MNDCPFQPLLNACHDGELDAAAQRRFKRHLMNCPACAAALGSLHDLSIRIAAAVAANEDAEDSGRALARMHRAIDRAAAAHATAPVLAKPARGPILRFAASFAAIAASILIVGGVWLLDATRPSGAIGPNAVAETEAPETSVVAVAPDWERIATTLRADPRWGVMADSPFAPHYADAIHWMLDGLKLTEETPWPLPKSF
jgi:anti-sigma factor RsiW